MIGALSSGVGATAPGHSSGLPGPDNPEPFHLLLAMVEALAAPAFAIWCPRNVTLGSSCARRSHARAPLLKDSVQFVFPD